MCDIAEITDDGFVKVLGRAKRFAKIGGEMVSITAVEELAASTWPESASAAISVAHPQRGEEIILFTEKPTPSRKDLLEKARANGIAGTLRPQIPRRNENPHPRHRKIGLFDPRIPTCRDAAKRISRRVNSARVLSNDNW